MYRTEKIEFYSHGSKISGIVFTPESQPKACITLFGPIGFVKEQSPIQYATRLAKEGYQTLIFDPRYYGESEGTPRQFENRESKVQDIISSVSYLFALNTNSLPVYAVGICQGTNWVAEAATRDPRIKNIALVASALLSPAMGANYLSNDEVKMKVARGEAARKKYESEGMIEYMHIGPIENDDTPAMMPFQHITDWYTPWEIRSDFLKYRGTWKNEVTSMSESLIWGYDVSDVMSQITQPIIMIHSDKAASGPITPKEMFARISSKDKKLVWFDDNQVQYQFYEDPRTIDLAVETISDWFDQPH